MTEKRYDYCGTRIEINKEYENGNIDAKIFPDREDISFIAGRFSMNEYRDILNEIIKNRWKVAKWKN